MAERESIQDDLVTVRDWLRYAVSRFSAAGLVYGHGTATALDEAAYLILHTLHLPIDQLDPWLDARLLASERAAVDEIIDRRIATRKPAPYLTHQAWIGGYSFYVDERVIVPRSYVGELLCRQKEAPEGEWHLGFDPGPVRAVLDLCTGSGCLAILAALTFPEAEIDASDVSPDALAVAGAQCGRLRAGGAHLARAIRPFCRPRWSALRPHPGQPALRRRGGAGGLPARVCGRTGALRMPAAPTVST